MQERDFIFKIDEKSIKNISKNIANEVANRIYCEFMLARYMPEVFDIENGNVVLIKIEDFKQKLLYRINSMAK